MTGGHTDAFNEEAKGLKGVNSFLFRPGQPNPGRVSISKTGTAINVNQDFPFKTGR